VLQQGVAVEDRHIRQRGLNTQSGLISLHREDDNERVTMLARSVNEAAPWLVEGR
jgi:hypothetical protein